MSDPIERFKDVADYTLTNICGSPDWRTRGDCRVRRRPPGRARQGRA